MDRNSLKQSLIFPIVLILLSLSVYAQEARFTETLSKIGEFIFKDFGSLGAYGFKFLLWIALFALMDYGLTSAKFSARVSGVIAFVVSAATIIIIPGESVISIFRLYSYIVVMMLGLVVPLILFWTLHRKFPGKELGEKLIKASLYLIMAVALFWFTANATNLLGGFP